MPTLIDWAGHAAAIVGVVVCLAAGIGRLAGSYVMLGYGNQAWFLAGVAAMVFACLVRLYSGSTRQAGT